MGVTEVSSRKQPGEETPQIKSHSLLLILAPCLAQEQSIFSREGKGQGGKDTPPPAQSRHRDPLVTSQYNLSFVSSHRKKQKGKKSTTPLKTPLPTGMGKTGYSTLGSGKNREQKKRLAWSSASWSGSPWPPLLPSTARRSEFSRRASVLLCCQLSSTKAPMGARRYGQEGVGGCGAEVPKAPALGGGDWWVYGAVCLFFFWTGPAT